MISQILTLFPFSKCAPFKSTKVLCLQLPYLAYCSHCETIHVLHFNLQHNGHIMIRTAKTIPR